MTFRTRILLACLTAALIPLALLAAGARGTIRDRLDDQYQERVAQSRDLVRSELAGIDASIDAQLDLLARRLLDDPQLRSALLDPARARELIDFAPEAMRSSGLDYLLLLDETGSVMTSGHFRNEYERDAAALRDLLLALDGPAVVAARTPAGSMLAVVRADELRIGERRLALAAGVRIDSTFVARLGGGWSEALGVALAVDAATVGVLPAGEVVSEQIAMPFIDATGAAAESGEAVWTIAHSVEPLTVAMRSIDRWFVAALAAAVLFAFVIARLLAHRTTRPLEELARRAARVELARYDVPLATTRRDEIGSLSRLLDRMVQRLRTGAMQLREAERRATIGDLARQVNHDVRNGLLPIRNVIGHLADVARESPAQLATVFNERAGTLQAGIGYLENLATNYARLSPRMERLPCDINALIEAMLHESAIAGDARLRAELARPLPEVTADPVALRRVVENLAVNALESLPDGNGSAVIRTQERAGSVVIAVSDTGAGMTSDMTDRIFDDFYTTKQRGTGLGLSIVRRLVADMGGRISVSSEPQRGTTFTIELPARD